MVVITCLILLQEAVFAADHLCPHITEQSCPLTTLDSGDVVQLVLKIISSSVDFSLPPGLTTKRYYCAIPDCLSGPCHHGWCKETMEGYQCHCSEGFTGTDCSEDVDECTYLSNPCANGVCNNRIGLPYNCICNSGYVADESGQACVDEDECGADSSLCANGVCYNLVGLPYICTCDPGYVLYNAHGTGQACVVRRRDCSELHTEGVNISGVYPIYPNGFSNALDVYCDMATDGGGWTVFQRRQDGSVDFYLRWSYYKNGFGNVAGEHWLGNDNIYRLSTQNNYELRVDLEDFEGNTRYASYNRFSIGNEIANYILAIGVYSGNAGDSLAYHRNMAFSTRDSDNDADNLRYCAVSNTGAWWYNACLESNLNGQYLNGTFTAGEPVGVVWGGWRAYNYSFKSTEMKIRAVSYP